MKAPVREFPLRGLIIATVVALVVVPTAAGFIAWRVVERHQQAALLRQIIAARILVTDRLSEPHTTQWQRALQRGLGRLGMVAVITEKTGSGKREVYPSTSVLPTPKPSLGLNVLLPNARSGVSTNTAVSGKHLYLVSLGYQLPSRTVRLAWALIAGLSTAAVGLVVAFWLLGRWVTRPLRSLSGDVDHIASGEALPIRRRSRVREIENIGQALVGMNAALAAARRNEANVDRERRFMISAIAHDLRTPLFALRGYLQAHELGVGDAGDDYLRLAEEKAEQIDRLVADLFGFTRLELLDERPDFTPVDLAGLLERTVDAFRQSPTSHPIELAVSPAARVHVLGNEDMLERVAGNLIDNAIRHGEQNGVVSVDWGEADGEGWFSVSDDGPGISEQDVPHLFDPLYQANDSRKGNGGAGLGLAIAKRIVDAHGGAITVRNAGGAVFTVTLPLAKGTAPSSIPDRDPAAH